MGEKTRDQQAREVAENYVRAMYTRLHRSTIEKNWGCSDEELAQLEYTADGYLVCRIQSSRIIANGHDTNGFERWMIEVVPDIGIEVEPDVIKVSQSADKNEWVQEREIAS